MPEDAVIAEFVNSTEAAEGQLDYPLILAGSRMIPRLCRDIQRRDFPRRLYAMHALGDFGRPAAIPSLEKVLADEGEAGCFRAQALDTIHRIDERKGVDWAKRLKTPLDPDLKRSRDEILFSRSEIKHMRHTYVMALRNFKD
jgi:HEAT repeat protein